MAKNASNVDSEFLNAGKSEGLEIWRIEKFNVVKVKKDKYGTFSEGDSYLILRTFAKTNTRYEWNIHYWLGINSSLDEMATAAIKAVELDDFLGGSPVQYREVQYHESKLFNSYFEPNGIRYMQGGVSSGFNQVAENTEKKLYMVKGR
jgi:hypothetical protein